MCRGPHVREEPGIWAQGGAAVAGARWWMRWRDSEASLSDGAGRAVPAGKSGGKEEVGGKKQGRMLQAPGPALGGGGRRGRPTS